MVAITGFAWVVMTLFSVAFIALLQQLMHWVDWDVEDTVTWPWRHELAYTAFFALSSAVILSLVNILSEPLVGLTMTNCVLLILSTYNNVILTLRNKVVATAWTLALVSIYSPGFSWPLVVLFTGYVFLLWAEQRWFLPFDAHPTVTVLVQFYLGVGYWLLADNVGMDTRTLPVMLISFALSTVTCYVFTVLLHNDHVRSLDSAKNARTDGLTGARNWMSFRDDTGTWFDGGTPFLVIAFDIDHFKRINDTYGHLVGNHVLTGFCGSLQATLSAVEPAARLYRTGGEEFMVVVPDMDATAGRQLAKRCQKTIRELQVLDDDGQPIHVTASIGISATTAADERANAVYRRADSLLYRAKQGGRNRIVGDD
ncbi:GGDEF domain-containing protein [Lacticaseibacillus pantheris]|uniref:GGDEF domain-containing protein n=1 Tax=Lacticaseibacillus pantheris TaxID=171523 RepID=UPI0026587B16|nr:GGDEF domain-containing protein [Lacticaseibacillus pantheris]WKF84293.1 GGDEF domain-containing protein [Lacticaseibacillus pantheris]